jgi:hypothetical protein
MMGIIMGIKFGQTMSLSNATTDHVALLPDDPPSDPLAITRVCEKNTLSTMNRTMNAKAEMQISHTPSLCRLAMLI